MVSIDAIRASNSRCKDLHDLVAVFVGGTGGIGEITAKELFRHITRPKVYIIGRNEVHGGQIVNELQRINPQGTAVFIRRDISLIQNVDELCSELCRLEPKINCLFITAGHMAAQGRVETSEGLDRKMCVNYYARMRCIMNLMGPLTAASEAKELSRVVDVLAAGSESDIDVDDLDLRENYGLLRCLAHCVIFTDFMIEEFAKRHPGTTFAHSFPGTVKTGLVTELSGPVRLAAKLLYAVMSSWIINMQESGERHLFQLTSRCYPPAATAASTAPSTSSVASASNTSDGIPAPDGLDTMVGADGKIGSGAYRLNWDGSPAGDESVLGKYREINMGQKIWEHTMAMFEQAKSRMRRLPKRNAPDEAEGAGRTIPNPIGWRPA